MYNIFFIDTQTTVGDTITPTDGSPESIAHGWMDHMEMSIKLSSLR